MAPATDAITPRRIFLDTCTFQTLADCGGYVFGEDDFPMATDYSLERCPQVLRRTDAREILGCLRSIFLFNERTQFDWIVSRGSIEEVDAGGDQYRSSYIRDIIDHSSICLNDNPPTETADTMVAYIAGPKCGFLSEKDKRLLAEAAEAECNVFLTIEKRLPRMADAILLEIPLLQRRASYKTRKGRCSALNCCMFLS